MSFEQGSADIFVETVSEVTVQVLQPLFMFIGSRRVLDTVLEKLNVPLQGVLVHRVDHRKVQNAEEEQTGSKGHGSEAFSGSVDFLLGYLRFSYSLVDFLGEFLGVGQLVDHSFVLQHVVNVSDLAEGLEDGVFDLEEFFLVSSISLDDF